MGFKGILCAIQAGMFAALASVSAKIATSSDASIYLSKLLDTLFDVFGLPFNLPVVQVAPILRVCGVGGIFLCNALMWTLFTKSMHLCSSVIEATSFNTASNFFFTAFLSFFLFDEHIGLQWYLGSMLMVIGLVILHRSSSDDSKMEERQTRQDKLQEQQDGVKRQKMKKVL